ncbi:beta-N-acetylhexosaminidase [Oceanobacter sp. 5_MG-2023]|uniref:beta-N-acetylhexosaminidase n=1 Tax=Oceanobacter sp. 5_MG-2023 TaxID=3062645 RepID=UPI0026E2483F|nr:beta-N-acetylhexosaminidase [Oceanobacter sp. 5_MG-2023]MDO6681492.1 beta-N-acetylhexosaminidase [Oceanobacter sp. 5_MG-2023]
MSRAVLNDTAAVGVVADLLGTQLLKEDWPVLESEALSGLILFGRNYQNPQQLQRLTADVRQLRPDLPLFVDQEGGRVQRFREGFTRLPAMALLGQWFQSDPEAAQTLAHDIGWLMATELAACGVDVSFAPVLDIERGCSQVIGDRAFATHAAVVSVLAAALVDGMAAAGMQAVGKHFPGHGAVIADSHRELPVDYRSLAQLDYDMRPFQHLIASGRMAGVMPAHVIYPALDSAQTAGFSRRWLTLLRQQLAFSGVIFSDDLTMEGAASYGSYRQRAELAMTAGCNALVVCNRQSGELEVLQHVEQALAQGRPRLDLSDWRCLPATASTTAATDSSLERIRAELAVLTAS